MCSQNLGLVVGASAVVSCSCYAVVVAAVVAAAVVAATVVAAAVVAPSVVAPTNT